MWLLTSLLASVFADCQLRAGLRHLRAVGVTRARTACFPRQVPCGVSCPEAGDLGGVLSSRAVHV